MLSLSDFALYSRQGIGWLGSSAVTLNLKVTNQPLASAEQVFFKQGNGALTLPRNARFQDRSMLPMRFFPFFAHAQFQTQVALASIAQSFDHFHQRRSLSRRVQAHMKLQIMKCLPT
jgi:hypothetical protein